MLYTGDIEDKCVADLGCGTGMLSIASQILGASYTGITGWIVPHQFAK